MQCIVFISYLGKLDIYGHSPLVRQLVMIDQSVYVQNFDHACSDFVRWRPRNVPASTVVFRMRKIGKKSRTGFGPVF